MTSVENGTSRRRVSLSQLETLWEFLDAHKEMAAGYNKSAQARGHAKRLWESIAQSLNNQEEGAFKDWKGWSNYWTDYKSKLKKRVAAVRSSLSGTGGGPSNISPLTTLEEKFLSLLGEGFGLGLPGIQQGGNEMPSTSEEAVSLPELMVLVVQNEEEEDAWLPPEPPAISVSVAEASQDPPPPVAEASQDPPPPVAEASQDSPPPTRPRQRNRRSPYIVTRAEARERLLVDSANRAEMNRERNAILLRIADALERIAQMREPRD